MADRSPHEVKRVQILSFTTNATSSVFDKQSYGNCTVQVNFTSGTSFILTLQGSMDYNSDLGTGNWVSVPYTTPSNGAQSTSTVTLSSTGVTWYFMVPFAYQYLRATVSGAAGTPTGTIIVQAMY